MCVNNTIELRKIIKTVLYMDKINKRLENIIDSLVFESMFTLFKILI